MKRILVPIAFVILLLGAGYVASGPIDEKDVFWHIASGRFMLAEHRLPEPDPFTYTAGARRDVHHEWLSQIGLALCDRWFSLNGLRLLRALLSMLTLGLGAVAFRRRTKASFLILAGLSLWLVLYQPNVTIRPHLVGWVLSVLVLGLLVEVPPPWSRRRWAGFFLLLVLWANLHSSVLYAPAVLAIYAAGALLESWRNRTWDVARWRHLGGLILISVLAILAQPAGPRLIPYVLATPALNRGLSVEWLPLFAADMWPRHAAMLIAWGITVLGVAFAWWSSCAPRTDPFPGPWVSLFCLLGALPARRMTFFLFLPLLYSVEGITRWWKAAPRRSLPAAVSRAASLLLVGAALLLSRRPDVPWFTRNPLVPGRFPEEGAGFLAQFHLTGHMFNPVEWGGYLSYRLYPEYKTLGDGRWNLISRDVVLDAERVLGRRGPVEDIFDRYDIDYLIEPLSYYLRAAPLPPERWSLAYHDAATVILLRRTARFPENARRVLALYAADPRLRAYATWRIAGIAFPGRVTPLSIPSVLTEGAGGQNQPAR